MADRAPKESTGGRCSAFCRFVYNSQKGTILGRNGKSWGKYCMRSINTLYGSVGNLKKAG